MLRLLAVVVVMSSVVACQPTARDRMLQRRDIDDPERRAISRKQVELGMREVAVRASWGEPCDVKRTTNAEGQSTTYQYCNVCPSTQRGLSVVTKSQRPVECVGEKVVTFTGGLVTELKQ